MSDVRNPYNEVRLQDLSQRPEQGGYMRMMPPAPEVPSVANPSFQPNLKARKYREKRDSAAKCVGVASILLIFVLLMDAVFFSVACIKVDMPLEVIVVKCVSFGFMAYAPRAGLKAKKLRTLSASKAFVNIVFAMFILHWLVTLIAMFRISYDDTFIMLQDSGSSLSIENTADQAKVPSYSIDQTEISDDNVRSEQWENGSVGESRGYDFTPKQGDSVLFVSAIIVFVVVMVEYVVCFVAGGRLKAFVVLYERARKVPRGGVPLVSQVSSSVSAAPAYQNQPPSAPVEGLPMYQFRQYPSLPPVEAPVSN